MIGILRLGQMDSLDCFEKEEVTGGLTGFLGFCCLFHASLCVVYCKTGDVVGLAFPVKSLAVRQKSLVDLVIDDSGYVARFHS